MMRKISFALAAFAALSVASCTAELVPENGGEAEKGVRHIVLSASIDNSETKSFLDDDYMVIWEVGDKIAVYDGVAKREFTVTTCDGKSAEFEGDIAEAASEVSAAYPFSTAIVEDGVLNAYVPAVQTLASNNVAPDALASYAEPVALDGTLLFKNQASLLVVNVAQTDNVTSFVFKGNDGETVAAASETVTLKPQGDKFAAGNYIMTVKPMTFSKGVSITAEGTSSKYVFETTASASFVRNGGLDAGNVVERGLKVDYEGVVDNGDGSFTLTFTVAEGITAGSADIIPLDGDNNAPVSAVVDAAAKTISAVAPKSNSYAVVVPAGLAKVGEDGQLIVSVPAQQSGELDIIKAAIATTADMNIALTPISSEVSYDSDFSDVVTTKLSGQRYEQVSGDIVISQTETGLQTSVVEKAGCHEISVSKKGSVKVQMIPAEMIDGFFVKQFTADGTHTGAFDDEQKANEAGSVYDFGKLSDKVVTSYNVSDFDTFKTLAAQVTVGTTTSQNDTIAATKGWRLHESTINIMSDIIFPETVKIEFSGLPMMVSFTLKGNTHAFDGNDACRMLTLGNQVNANFENLTIKRGAFSGNGAGIMLASGVSGNLSAQFKDCRFEDNKTPSSSSGGAIVVQKATVTLDNCTFTGNYARNGSAIYTASPTADLTCRNCHFVNNTSYNTGGSSNNSGGRQVYENCEFRGNSTEIGAGGAIHANAEGCVVNLTGCTFTDCHSAADKAGAISLQTAELVIDNCTFDKCYAKDGGVLYLQAGAASKVTVKNSTISDCYATNEGGVFQQRAGELIMTSVTFTNNSSTAKALSGVGHIWGESKASFKDCTFTGNIGAKGNWTTSNSASGAGVMAISAGDVTFDGCTFDGNCGSTASVFDLRGDAFVKADNCVFKNNTTGSRGTVKLSGACVFFGNNCSFFDNSMKTSDWGIIIHGGNPAVSALNNCTFYNNTPLVSGGNSVLVNNDGSTLIANSTLIGDAALASIRNTSANNGATVLIVNDIVINTLANGNVFREDAMMVRVVNGGHNILGVNSAITNFISDATTDVTGATIATLANGSWDSNSCHYIWDGPASTVTSADVTATMSSNFKPNVTCKRLSANQQANVGDAFVSWLTSIDAFKTRKASTMWPGSYEK